MSDRTDPFKGARESCPVAKCEFQNRVILMLLRHADVREPIAHCWRQVGYEWLVLRLTRRTPVES